jgi:putative transposase
MYIGPSEAEPFWTAFLRKPARRGRRGVKLAISDAPTGLEPPSSRPSAPPGTAAARSALSCAGRSGRRLVSAFVATAFALTDAESAKQQCCGSAPSIDPFRLPVVTPFFGR